jgi:hypothetical protein
MATAFKKLPSYELLHQTFNYDPETGFLYRKSFRGKPTEPYIVGSEDRTGHLHVYVSGHSYPVIRVIWKMWYNEEPPEEIDHFPDPNPQNNRINNLRAATSQQNQANRTLDDRNKLGVKGMHERKNRWLCVITSAGETFRQSFPKTPEGFDKGVEWLKKMRETLNGEFANHGV